MFEVSSTTDTTEAIWDKVIVQIHTREDNVVVRELLKARITKRVHHIRAPRFGLYLHGRVQVQRLLRTKPTRLNFFQFLHVWTCSHVKNEFKIDRLVGSAHPSFLSLV